MTEKNRIVDALVGVWRDIRDVTVGFTDEQWAAPSPCPGWSAHDVVAHIVGTEEMLRGTPSPEASGERPAHVRNEIGAVNEVWVEHLRSLSPAELLARFDEVTAARAEALRAMSEEEFHAESWTPEGPGTYAGFMRIRVFDCWVHEQDLRSVAGAEGGYDSDAAELAVAFMVAKLGFVVGKRAGAPQQSTVTFELTGPLARTASVLVDGRARVLDSPAENPTATLKLPTSQFVCLYAGRVAGAAVADRVEITGDEELGRRVRDSLGVTV
ncbi:maleylpyruvate isomerase family mycothiol-dependent enzyme [Dietzia alimentaria]|uniref:maleylpyruvate isomerase family mycothiol-dependent enzyme n=1 Tax=Dietzia alimentaria TaxID=665550 RepID=UPI00029A4142|nr:maleylpyruvate isomerase family mycothiol-dependent enzyme [Dietzia alimentaria]